MKDQDDVFEPGELVFVNGSDFWIPCHLQNGFVMSELKGVKFVPRQPLIFISELMGCWEDERSSCEITWAKVISQFGVTLINKSALKKAEDSHETR